MSDSKATAVLEALDAYRVAASDLEPGSLSSVPDSHGRTGDCHRWLSEYDTTGKGSLTTGWDFRNYYSYAIPNLAAVEAIRRASPHGVIEIGAGIGYWAHVMRCYGLDVLAVDRSLSNNNYFPESGSKWVYGKLWTKIVEGDEHILDSDEHSRRTLVLCWPDTDQFADRCLQRYRGDTLVYVGESKNMATGSDEFHDMIAKDWTPVERVSIPRLRGRFDSLVVYGRN